MGVMSDALLLEFTVYNVLWVIAIVLVWAIVTYLVIRFGVYHGLRAHTRWIDGGKDDHR